MTIKSIGEEFQELLDKGLEREEAKAVMAIRHKRVTTGLTCPECKSKNTYRRGKRCSHEFKCRDCGYWWCTHNQLMSPKDRALRKSWSKRHQEKSQSPSNAEIMTKEDRA